MPEAATSGTAPRVALLARAGKASDNLADALRQAGAEVVLAADPSGLDEQGLRAADVQAVLVALEPGVEQVLDRLDGVLSDPDMTVIFDEADIAAHRAGWDAARWVRHLTAKLHRHADVLPPGTEADQSWHPSPGQLPKPAAAFTHLDLAPFAQEAIARADSVPADGIQLENPQAARAEPTTAPAEKPAAREAFAALSLAAVEEMPASVPASASVPSSEPISASSAADAGPVKDDVFAGLSLTPMEDAPAPSVAAVVASADVASMTASAPASAQTPQQAAADDVFAGLSLTPIDEAGVADAAPTAAATSQAYDFDPVAFEADTFAGLSLEPLADAPAPSSSVSRSVDAAAAESIELPAFDLEDFDATAGRGDARPVDPEDGLPAEIALESLLKIGQDSPETLPPLAVPEPEFRSFSVIDVGDLRIEEHQAAAAPTAAAPLSFDDDDFFLQELSLGRDVPAATPPALGDVDVGRDEDFDAYSIASDAPAAGAANAELIDFDARLRAELAAFEASGAARPVPSPPVAPPERLSGLALESEAIPAAVPPAIPAEAASRPFTRSLSDLEQRISGLSLVDYDENPQASAQPADNAAVSGVVLIEAGLGGPDPVRQLLAAIPGGFPAQVLVRLHLQGGRYDRLVAQMARAASLPVALAEAGEGAAPRTIHFLPEGVGVNVDEAGLIFIVDPAPPAALYAALPPGNSAVVFLSGSDPALVDVAMSAASGGALVLAQSPEDCYDGTACAELRARGAACALPADLAGRLSSRWPSRAELS